MLPYYSETLTVSCQFAVPTFELLDNIYKLCISGFDRGLLKWMEAKSRKKKDYYNLR